MFAALAGHLGLASIPSQRPGQETAGLLTAPGAGTSCLWASRASAHTQCTQASPPRTHTKVKRNRKLETWFSFHSKVISAF